MTVALLISFIRKDIYSKRVAERIGLNGQKNR